jgi:hypothetical protein
MGRGACARGGALRCAGRRPSCARRRRRLSARR